MKFELEELSLVNHALAEFVGIPKSTLDRAASQGRLQSYAIGTRGETRFVRIADVMNFKTHDYKPEKSNESRVKKAK
jgi:hypothetical protein